MPFNEKLGFCLPAGKSMLRFHYRQIFTRTPGQIFFVGWYSPLMKKLGFASQLEKVCLGSTIAEFLPGPLGKKILLAVQPLNEKLGFCCPPGKSLLRFHYRQIFTRSPGQKIFAGWHKAVTGPTGMRRGPYR
jgi:hypothetical protein